MLNGLSCVIRNGGRQIDRAILLVSAMLCSADTRHRALRRLSRDVASKAGAAWLAGQPAVYLRAQLVAFASGARRNDIGEQMRNGARRMTAKEIEAVSQFYADRP